MLFDDPVLRHSETQDQALSFAIMAEDPDFDGGVASAEEEEVCPLFCMFFFLSSVCMFFFFFFYQKKGDACVARAVRGVLVMAI
jgi:hypothetical protein